jgi:hypothetical protein
VTDILYIKDMLTAFLYKDENVLYLPLRLMQSASTPVGTADFTKIGQARNELNSLFMIKVHNDSAGFNGDMLILNQYIPLPAFKSKINKNSDAITDFMSEFRQPLFFGMFIIVLAVQIFWKKSAADKENQQRKENMGPIERQLVDRGGALNDRQMKEVQELDGMIKGMGNIGGLDAMKGGLGSMEGMEGMGDMGNFEDDE